MTSIVRASSKALVLAGVLLAGCAGEGNENLFTTGALGTSQSTTAAAEPKVDPACVSLTARIDALRREGIVEKVEKASLKKYKMTQADLSKADQLNKANADFQSRCASPMPKPTTAQPATPSYLPPKTANSSQN
jgi:hypothetical protein